MNQRRFTWDLIRNDTSEFPPPLHEELDRIERADDEVRAQRRIDAMARENSRPFRPHVLSVEPADRKAA